ncbi:uncharacterized protein UV8b_07783 [Ustilaginoidea virens]|uniref:Uncharacterized protein n=1 Tax=Ustilaginoidea virens TaxID=1159556 RepID=A0A063BUK7_USTVR|nr:uncharacterized protein UV8b_07783 [Ustilaginoidea virens]QUC23542.1 hypothetical protein UV8b_07783 [Ustilaginoidea virens]GAO15895.1 hypothetical protein UVI_02051250 [Ustilaginoidea virens]
MLTTKLARKPVVAVLGPTASGKTKLGVAIAKAFLGEVISVDSLQCYKPGSIATAKPRPEEMEGVPHHLVDYLEADEEPADFVAEAAALLDGLTAADRLPVLVGGSTSLTIPVLREAFRRDYQVFALLLIPQQPAYEALVKARGREMLERGLLEELAELWDLERALLGGRPCFERGVWKTIGYPEFHPYLKETAAAAAAAAADPGGDGAVPGKREILLRRGRDTMHANTLRYGLGQLQWIRESLIPFLHRKQAVSISLAVTDKASWLSTVESPALCMLNQLVLGHQVAKLPPIETPESQSRVICLFGGSSSGNNPAHLEAARSLGVALHTHGIKLVYGGGTTGIMGAVASTLVRLSGPDAVHGIIPAALAKFEYTSADRQYLSRFGRQTVVRDMHARKQLMMQSVIKGPPGSGFVALSGGYGTMEELLEIVTWYQLGIHRRGICVFSVDGFYDGLLGWLGQLVRGGFVGPQYADILGVARTADEAVECLARPQHKSGLDELEWA